MRLQCLILLGLSLAACGLDDDDEGSDSDGGASLVVGGSPSGDGTAAGKTPGGAARGSALETRCERFNAVVVDRFEECGAHFGGRTLTAEEYESLMPQLTQRCVSDPPGGMAEASDAEFQAALERAAVMGCADVCRGVDEGCTG